MRPVLGAVSLGATFGLAVAFNALVATAPATAQTDPPPTVSVVPGGPPFVLSGPYDGAGSATLGNIGFPCPGGTGFIQDTSGSFIHPSLGGGVYAFHLQLCVGEQNTAQVFGKGTFALVGSERVISGTLVMPTTPLVPFSPLTYAYELTAGGGCHAHFRAAGELRQLNDFPPLALEESGALTQIGAIVCRFTPG